MKGDSMYCDELIAIYCINVSVCNRVQLEWKAKRYINDT